MPRRLHHPKIKGIFQYREGGNFYTRIAGAVEVCLETNDPVAAESNLIYQKSLVTRFGVNAYKFTVASLFVQFLKDKKRTLRPKTHEFYTRLWDVYLNPSFGKIKIADVNQRSWDRFCKKNPSLNDFQNYRNLMSGFLVWCSGKGHINALPVIKNPSHKRRRRRIIPPQHLRQIFQQAQGSLLLFLSMALFQGMRRSEIMLLEWSRVDFDRLSLVLRDMDVKTDEGREMPMNETVRKLLVKRLADQQAGRLATKWVFPHATASRKHADLGGLMSAWRRCLLHCGLAERVTTTPGKYKIVVEYTWHDLRATYEKYSNRALEFTDTQKEKMVGAAIDVQKKIYVTMDADDLRGMELVVSNQVPELAQIIDRKTVVQKVGPGKPGGKTKLAGGENDASHG